MKSLKLFIILIIAFAAFILVDNFSISNPELFIKYSRLTIQFSFVLFSLWIGHKIRTNKV